MDLKKASIGLELAFGTTMVAWNIINLPRSPKYKPTFSMIAHLTMLSIVKGTIYGALAPLSIPYMMLTVNRLDDHVIPGNVYG